VRKNEPNIKTPSFLLPFSGSASLLHSRHPWRVVGERWLWSAHNSSSLPLLPSHTSLLLWHDLSTDCSPFRRCPFAPAWGPPWAAGWISAPSWTSPRAAGESLFHHLEHHLLCLILSSWCSH